MNESECFRVGRRFLDGATFEWLAERASCSQDTIADAWEVCRQRLSQKLAASSGGEFQLLSDEALLSDAERCVRWLLDWQEACDRTVHFSLSEDGGPSPSESTVPVGNAEDTEES